MKNKPWYLYIAKCADGTLYTGITVDIKRRVSEHNSGTGSKSIVKSKRPVKLVYKEQHLNQNSAAKREAAIKKWKREYKLKLINKGLP